MCFVIILSALITVFYDLRLLSIISSRYGGGVMMAVILFTGWYGLQVIRRNQDPEELMRWTAFSMSGDPQARPEDALVPMVRIFAGFLMLIPGPVTDLIGFLLMSPIFARPLARRFMARGGQQGVGGNPFGGMGGNPFGGTGNPFGGTGGNPFGGMGGHPFTDMNQEASNDETSTSSENDNPIGRRRRKRNQPSARPQNQTIIDVSGEVISSKSDEKD